MTHPDKEIWDKLKLNPERYERIPIPTAIWRILRPKVKNWTLVCYYVHKDEHGRCLDTDTERVIIMQYVICDGRYKEHKGGYCFTHFVNDEKLNDKLKDVAKEIAEEWPEYAVRHRNAN